jgi:hypothetical protein
MITLKRLATWVEYNSAYIHSAKVKNQKSHFSDQDFGPIAFATNRPRRPCFFPNHAKSIFPEVWPLIAKSDMSAGSRAVYKGHVSRISGLMSCQTRSVFSSRKRYEQPRILYSLERPHTFLGSVPSSHHRISGCHHQARRSLAMALYMPGKLRRPEAPATACTAPEVPKAM